MNASCNDGAQKRVSRPCCMKASSMLPLPFRMVPSPRYVRVNQNASVSFADPSMVLVSAFISRDVRSLGPDALIRGSTSKQGEKAEGAFRRMELNAITCGGQRFPYPPHELSASPIRDRQLTTINGQSRFHIAVVQSCRIHPNALHKEDIGFIEVECNEYSILIAKQIIHSAAHKTG